MEKTYSKYAKEFNESCVGWDKDKEVSKMYVRYVQSKLNDVLERSGIVFLSEAYDWLSLKYDRRDIAIRTVGWLHADFTEFGDGFIDIQMDEKEDGSYILDFNVDGYIVY